MATFSHFFNEEIFTTHDIRGIFNKDINKKDAFYIGVAFGNFLNKRRTLVKKFFGFLIGEKPKVVIGMDARESTNLLAEEFIKGLVVCGVNVVNVADIPVPTVFYSVSHFDCEAGVSISGFSVGEDMITIKFVLNDERLTGEQIKEFCSVLEEGLFISKIERGVINEIEILETYITEVLSILKFSPQNKLRVGVDCLNGTTGNVLIKMFKRLPFRMFLKNEQYDEEMDIRQNPLLEENIKSLGAFIQEKGLDIAFSLDGDGGQLIALTKEGNVLKGDELFYIIARNYLQNSPKNKKVVLDLASSIEIEKKILELGGKPIFASTGQSSVREKMLKSGAKLGVEAKGHIYIKDGFYGYDDGIFAILKIISILSFEEKTIAEILNEMPFTFETSEIRIKTMYEDEKYAEIQTFLKEKIVVDKIMEEGGMKFIFAEETASIMIRVCNTEDAISFKAEARNIEDFMFLEKLLEEIKQKFF
jgi:phosphomannomutase